MEKINILNINLKTKIMKTGKWEFWQERSGKWYFHLKAKNGKVVLQSEGYETVKGCRNGIKSIKENIDSPIINLTTKRNG